MSLVSILLEGMFVLSHVVRFLLCGFDYPSTQLTHLDRWAAKEATVKAVTWRKLNFHEIVIRRPRYGGGMHAVILDKPASKTMPSVRRLNLSDPGTQGVQGHRNKSADDHSGRASNPLHDEALGLKSASYVSTTSGQLHPGTTEPAQVSTQDADNIQDHTAVDERDHDLSGQIAQISISHDGEYATAVCIAAQDAMEGDVGGEAAARDHL